jgi:hypothetical protein
MPNVAEDLGGGGGCMAWRFQQQDKRQKAMGRGKLPSDLTCFLGSICIGYQSVTKFVCHMIIS